MSLSWTRISPAAGPDLRENLAAGATLTASNTRGGGDKTFAAARVLDGRRDTYWATEDAVTTPELVVELPQTTTFNVVDLRECLPLGSVSRPLLVDAWRNGKWEEFAAGTSIGSLGGSCVGRA